MMKPIRLSRSEELLKGRNLALSRLAAGRSLEDVLAILVETAERVNPALWCSVLLLDRKKGQLRHGAAPSLPADYNLALDGMPIGPGVGSCGTAAHSGKRVIVDDVMTHPFWADFRDLARRGGFRACWSEPILAQSGLVVGTFAMYFQQVGSPESADIEIMQAMAHLAGIVIECRQGEMERAALAAQLRQRQKLDALGTLASGVAHEINNPIQGIMNYAQLLQKQPGDNAEVGTYAREILHEAERVAGIVHQLLRYSRQESTTRCSTSVLQIVGGVVTLLRSALDGDAITLNIEIPDDLPEVYCHSQQIQQVIMNGVANARDALNSRPQPHTEGGVVTVRAETFSRSGTPWLAITIEDNGIGMSQELIERAFDPFFTTKAPNHGTGLGLCVSHGIVSDHNGSLYIESEPRQFTRLHIELPVVPSVRVPNEASPS